MSFAHLWRLVAGIALVALSMSTNAQFGTPSSLKAESSGQALAFPTEASSGLGAVDGNRQSLYKPEGSGPFPAVLLLHNCGGPSAHLERWVRASIGAGHVVMIIDSLRGARGNCRPPLTVPLGLRVRDAFDAIAHLARLPYVDKSRISVLGFSQGAHVAIWLTSPSVASAIAQEGTPRVAAAMAAYAFCSLAPNPVRPQGAIVVQDDTDRPLLVLLGGEDKESPPESCLDRLPKLKKQGVPVEWHLYPNATHGWDQFENSGRTKTDWKGDRITNFYDEATTVDSVKRTMDFLGRHNPAQGR